MKIAAVVLAAGASERMGTNKLLIPIEGLPLLRRVVQAVVRAGIEEILVVTRPEVGELQEVLSGLPILFAPNPEPCQGMGSSIAVGIRAASPDADGFLIVLGDMPWIRPDLLQAIAEHALPEGIVVPRHSDREGNPVCFGETFRAELESLTGDRGARIMIEAHRDRVRYVDWPEEQAFADLDRPEDLPPPSIEAARPSPM